MKDRSPEILQFASSILAQADAVLRKARSADPADFDKTTVASELLVILHTAEELLAFFDPPIDPAEYQGVPRSMRAWDEEPRLILRSKEGFDFRPWYAEKSASLEGQAMRLTSAWRRDLEQVQIRPEDGTTPEGAFVEDLIRNVEGVRAYAQVIFDLTSERRVMVQEIRFGPEDSN